jgi:DNA-binding transcriptional ArsR family regulator
MFVLFFDVCLRQKWSELVSSKIKLFDIELQGRANLFRILAHPARLQILQYLVQTKTCISGDISDMFPLTRTTINQHMKELKDAGIISGHKEGSKTVYCLDCSKIGEIRNILEGFLKEIDLPQNFYCKYN